MAVRIAVVNNDTAFLKLMHELLSDEGYETHAFREGANDYPALRDLAPDVIILDIRLEQPEGGWNLLELCRLDPTLAKTPIIVCSADVRALQERALYLQSQHCQVLPKPFDLDALLDLLKQVRGEASGPA
ncbi:MAG TPA: response regulator [Chloroflexota bacterium]|nr:response regulator [Chloroflexota bacterium]